MGDSEEEDSSFFMPRDDEEPNKSRSRLFQQAIMGDSSSSTSKLYEYLFQDEDDDTAAAELTHPPSIVATSHGGDDDDFDTFLSPSVTQLQQRLYQTQDTVRHQQRHIQNLERHYRRNLQQQQHTAVENSVYDNRNSSTPNFIGSSSSSTPSSVMTTDASRRFLDVVQDMKAKHAMELDEWKRRLVQQSEKYNAELQRKDQQVAEWREQLERQLESLGQELVSAQTANETAVRDASGRLDQCQDELKRRTKEVTDAAESLQESKLHVDALTNQLEQCQSELQACREGLVTERALSESVQTSLKEQLDQCQKELLSTKENLTLKEDDLMVSKCQAEKQLEECQLELLECRESLSARDDAAVITREERNQFANELEACQRDLQARGEELTAEKSQVVSLKKGLDAAECAYENARKEYELVQSQLNDEREHRVKVEEEHRNLESSLVEMQAKLNAREQELANKKAPVSRQIVVARKEDHNGQSSDDHEEKDLGSGSLLCVRDYGEDDATTVVTPCSTHSSSLVHHSLELGSSLMGLIRTPEGDQDKTNKVEQETTALQQLEAMSDFLDRVDVRELLDEHEGVAHCKLDDNDYDEEVEMVPLELYLELQKRLDLLEEERNILLTETLDLLESARIANTVEMDVFQAELKEQSAKKVKQEVDEQITAVLDTFTHFDFNASSVRGWRDAADKEKSS